MPTVSKDRANDPVITDGGGLDVFWGDGFGGDDDGGKNSEPEKTPPPEGYRIGIWLTIVSICMLFLTLSSAYLFTRAGRQSLIMPGVLWLSTALIMASSITIEIAKRSLRRRLESRFKFWINLTFVLGTSFLVSQLAAWRELVATGFYINSNIRSGYAYIFTALHGVHLIGGLAALVFVTFRPVETWTVVRRRASVEVAALYWHFLDLLWIYLLALIFLWG